MTWRFKRIEAFPLLTRALPKGSSCSWRVPAQAPLDRIAAAILGATMRINALFVASALLVAGCTTVPPEPLFPSQGEFGPEQSFTGLLRLGFERQSFDECWLDFRGSAMADLGRLAPSPALADQMASYSADVTLTGRRRAMVNVAGNDWMGQGFGHLGMYPCLIEATRITAARMR